MNSKGWLSSRIHSFVYGLALPLTAFEIIRNRKKLLAWSLVPVVLTFLLYIWLVQVLISRAQTWLGEWIAGHGWDPNSLWTSLLVAISKLAILLVGAFTFSAASSVVASPFNDILAEAAEPYTRPPLTEAGPQPWSLKLRLLVIDLGKNLTAMAATVGALLLSWVPLLNVVAFLLLFLLVTFQYISYPQTRRGLGLGDGARFLWRYFYCCLGFGAAMSFLFSIPLLSSLVIPLAVVGGTQLVARAAAESEDFPRLR